MWVNNIWFFSELRFKLTFRNEKDIHNIPFYHF